MKEIVTFVMSMLLEDKKIVAEIWIILVSILFIMVAEFIPSVTICIFSLDLIVIVCLIRRQLTRS